MNTEKNDAGISAQIVGKNGTAATVTFVNDDSIHRDADFFSGVALCERFPHFKISFALIADKIGTLCTKKRPDGTDEYVMAEGKYTYRKNDEEIAYWQSILDRCGERAEIEAHSMTHGYAGEDDRGGTYTYIRKYSFEKVGTPISVTVPAGNVSAEISACGQMIRDVFGERHGRCFIRPGVGIEQNDYFYEKLYASGYLGSRDTTRQIVHPADFSKNRWHLPGYSTSHDTRVEDLTDYVDRALSEDGWCGFCFHYVHEDALDASETSPHSMCKGKFYALFSHTERLAEEGKLWIATFSEAAKYYAEWEKAELTFGEKNGKTTLTLSVGDLDPAVYDAALTVRVKRGEEEKLCAILPGQTIEIDGSRQKE